MRTRPLSSLLYTFATLLLLASHATLAATISFPADKPGFTFETPEGWTASHDPATGRMTVYATADEAFRITFLSTPPSTDPDTMNRGMGLTVDAAVKAVALKDEERGEIETTEVEAGRWFVAQRVDGKIVDQPVVMVFQLFNSADGRGFGMYSMGSPEADEARTADYEAMVSSITMVE